MKKDNHGYHTFFTFPGVRTGIYQSLDVLAQLTSALFWKHNFGPIHLYCDQRHLDGLKKYGVDKVYDSIDTSLMKRMPAVDERYWSFAKIFLAKELSETVKRFTILDTDLWLKSIPPTWDASADLQALHEEDFDYNFQFNPYPDPQVFLHEDCTGLDWRTKPLNCGVIHLNNPELVQNWYQLAKAVIDSNLGKEPMGYSCEIVFIEQRILATVAAGMGLKVATLIPSLFTTQIEAYAADAPNPWVPPLTSTDLLVSCEKSIRHIWGLKRTYHDVNVRQMVINTLYKDVDEVLGSEALDGYEQLLSDVKTLNQPTITLNMVPSSNG